MAWQPSFSWLILKGGEGSLATLHLRFQLNSMCKRLRWRYINATIMKVRVHRYDFIRVSINEHQSIARTCVNTLLGLSLHCCHLTFLHEQLHNVSTEVFVRDCSIVQEKLWSRIPVSKESPILAKCYTSSSSHTTIHKNNFRETQCAATASIFNYIRNQCMTHIFCYKQRWRRHLLSDE